MTKITAEEAGRQYLDEGKNMKDLVEATGLTHYELRKQFDKMDVQSRGRGRPAGVKSGPAAKTKAKTNWSKTMAKDFLSRPLMGKGV